MCIYKPIKILSHFIIIQFAILIFISIFNNCQARKEKKGELSRYRIEIALINPAKITIDGEEQQFVVLKKSEGLITCYRYGDPDKAIRFFKKSEFKIVKGSDDYIKGYLLSDTKESVSILLISKASNSSILEKHGIKLEHHYLGQVLNIPISEIRKIKVFRKGRTGVGMAVGATVGFVAAGIATAGYDPDEASGLIVLDKGEFFAGSLVLFTIPCTLVGGAIGSVKKAVKKYKINGSSEEYQRIRQYLDEYVIELPSEELPTPDELTYQSMD